MPRYSGSHTKSIVSTSPSLSAGGIDPLPDKHDIAKHCKVTVRTVDRWVVERKIPSIKLGPRCTRFRWADVERALNRLTVREVK